MFGHNAQFPYFCNIVNCAERPKMDKIDIVIYYAIQIMFALRRFNIPFSLLYCK